MLSQEKNERLTAVGPGTPMGNLLRRYWWPVATHDMARGEWLRDYVDGQDICAWVTQARWPTGAASTWDVRISA